MQNYLRNVAMCTVLVLSSCGSQEMTKSTVASSTTSSSSLTNLTGKYVSSCYRASEWYMAKSVLVATDKNLQFSDDYFESSTCEASSLVYQSFRSRDYTVSGNNLDAVIVSTKLTLLSDELIKEFNTYGYYGYKVWIYGQSVEIAGKGGADDLEIGDKVYTLVKMENGALYFGDLYYSAEYDGLTPERRAVDYQSISFKKQ